MNKVIIRLLMMFMSLSLLACTSNELSIIPEKSTEYSEDVQYNNSESNATEPDEKELDKLGGQKADDFYIEQLIESYLNSLIEAINDNDFSRVEKFLVYNSNLYNSQKKLVSDLYSKNIKEKLVDYNIYEIKESGKNGVYEVYVNENIAIKYPEEDFKSKEFNWIYTVIYDGDMLGISDIKEWTRD